MHGPWLAHLREHNSWKYLWSLHRLQEHISELKPMLPGTHCENLLVRGKHLLPLGFQSFDFRPQGVKTRLMAAELVVHWLHVPVLKSEAAPQEVAAVVHFSRCGLVVEQLR